MFAPLMLGMVWHDASLGDSDGPATRYPGTRPLQGVFTVAVLLLAETLPAASRAWTV